jgi:hypothetical protein
VCCACMHGRYHKQALEGRSNFLLSRQSREFCLQQVEESKKRLQLKFCQCEAAGGNAICVTEGHCFDGPAAGGGRRRQIIQTIYSMCAHTSIIA